MMNLNDIGELCSTLRESNCDLFIGIDSLPDLSEIVKLLHENNKITLIVFPGNVYNACPYPEIRLGSIETDNFSFSERENIFAVNVGLFAFESFRTVICSENINLILLFAECADETEYGYKSAYKWIGEFRAECSGQIHIVAFTAAGNKSVSNIASNLASPDAIYLNTAKEPFVRVNYCEKPRDTFMYAYRECVKYAYGSTAVIFSTRREAEAFRRYMTKCGVNTHYICGNSSHTDIDKAVDAIKEADCAVLVATKSALPLAFYINTDNVIYCGIPYSMAHISRCALFSKEYSVLCIYSEQDIETDRKIIASVSTMTNEPDREKLSVERNKKLDDLIKFLID